MRLGRRAFTVGAASAWALRALDARASDGPIGTFPLSVAIAEEGGQRVQDQPWIDSQLAEAERLYGPLGVHFKTVTNRILAIPNVHVESRADRDVLAAECAPSVINVFVVASLRDVDDGVTVRRGVHWHSGHRRYLIVSAVAGPTVLAHELGHYFGNGHSSTTDNVMSYDRTGAEVFFDARQASVIRTAARLAVSSGEVKLVREDRP